MITLHSDHPPPLTPLPRPYESVMCAALYRIIRYTLSQAPIVIHSWSVREVIEQQRPFPQPRSIPQTEAAEQCGYFWKVDAMFFGDPPVSLG